MVTVTLTRNCIIPQRQLLHAEILLLSAMNDVHYFRTMPVSGPKSYPNRIAVAGDLGHTHNTTSTVNHITSNHPNLIFLVGDVTYAILYLTNGTGAGCYSCEFPDTPIHETYQPRCDIHFLLYQPFSHHSSCLPLGLPYLHLCYKSTSLFI